MDQDQADLIDLATDAYRGYKEGRHVTTKGLLASCEVMPLMEAALTALGSDFHFARVASGNWAQRAGEILKSRERVSNIALMQLYNQDTSLLDYLGSLYAHYREAPHPEARGFYSRAAEVSDRYSRAVKEWAPVLIRTLSGMGPEMHLMTAALHDMAMATHQVTESDITLDDDSVSLL